MKRMQEGEGLQVGFRKEYLKTRPFCKVTFTFPGEAAR